VRLDTPLDAALSTIHHGIWRHMPVLDYYGKLHSILDLRDVLTQSIGPQGVEVWKGCSAVDILGSKRKDRLGEPSAGTIWRDVLSAYLLEHARRHTISVSTSVEAAALQMRSEQLTFLVVREEPGPTGGASPVVGLVSERSFLSFCTGPHPDGSTEPVRSIMTPLANVLHVSLTDPASQVIDIFFNNNVRHLPVIDGKGQLCGIISVRDLVRPLLVRSATD